MTTLPTHLNIADYFLDARIREGKGDRTALRTTAGDYSYGDVQQLSNRFGNMIRQAGCEPEQRVIIALPDGPEYVAALFGTLKIGGVVVMVNPHLRSDQLTAMFEYTRATIVITHVSTRETFAAASRDARFIKQTIVTGEDAFAADLVRMSDELETFPSHRDDPAIWLFSGGTSGQPKAVVQTHRSYVNTTECYGANVIGYTEEDITIAVPKLFFGYAMGSNLFFPFAVGGSAVLFTERCTPAVLFDMVERFRPTIFVNVPTMVGQMIAEPDAAERDFSSLRIATSAGEALPSELHERWNATFGVELLDGLGTAEMWHIFLSNRPGDVRPGTLGQAVPGFEVKVCDDEGRELPHGEVGYLWVRGDSRAIAYWQLMDETRRAFRGEWYVSEDMLSRDRDGYFTYAGRADDMLKVSGKWLSPQEIENCLLQHEAVLECAVVGVAVDGLTRPYAFVVPRAEVPEGFPGILQSFIKDRLEKYKCPREVFILDALPRTHLGKVDRGRLRVHY
ncbi:MAG: benzoate-CoA ligase family protein [Longimicrobiales bacterium]